MSNRTLLKWYYYRVLIILEKLKGNVNIKKLRAILLLEANFNTLNKILFSSRVILSLEKHRSIPYKIIWEYRGYLVVHVELNKILILDISNQQKVLIVIKLANAIDYYNRIIHPITGISHQSFSLGIKFIILLFGVIKHWKC